MLFEMTPLTTQRIKLLQRLLKESGWYSANIDGIFGPATLDGISNLQKIPGDWGIYRRTVGALQVFSERNGIDPGPVDGYWGPITDEAVSQLSILKDPESDVQPFQRPEDLIQVNQNHWPVQYSSEFNAFYGKKGSGLVTASLPYPHRLSWAVDTEITKILCHEKVRDSLVRVLTQVMAHYGMKEISRLRLDLFGGCYNDRRIRGGMKPSMHSWGIALDYDPINNPLRAGADKAAFARQEYRPWWAIWESEGWVSLGRARNFDWMHVQAAKIK